jgi:rsbT co-antagonist protein RsbR
MRTNAELEEQIIALKAAQATAEKLNQVSRDLNAAADEEEMLQALLQSMAESEVKVVDLMYIDLDQAGEPEWLEIVATWRAKGSPSFPIGSRFYVPEFPFSYLWMASPDEPQLISDVLTDERIDENSKNVLIQADIRAMAIVPLTQAGRWVGSIIMTWGKVHTFNPQESKILHTLGSLVGPVVENQRLLARTQEALRELRKLELAVEQTADGIAVTDLEGKIQFVNPAWAQMHGYSLEEIQDKHMSMFHTAEQMQDQAIPFGQQVMEAGVYYGETEHVKKDGATFSTTMTSSLLKDRAGDSIGFVSTARDITERKQVEEAIRRSKERLQDLVANLSDWIWEVDAQGRYIYSSEQVADILGYSPDEVLGKTPFDLMKPDEAARVGAIFADIAANQAPILNLENWNVAKDGREVCMLTNGTPRLDQDGNLIGYYGIDRDITDRKWAEAERERLQQQIIEAQQQTLQELSTPIIPVMERIIVMPLVGSIDSLRAKDIMRTLLAGIRAHRAQVVILDITGVPIVDSGVASHLDKTIQAARLKGAQTIITGITDAVAEAVVDLGIDWSGVETLSDLQTGLVTALSGLGFKLTRA